MNQTSLKTHPRRALRPLLITAALLVGAGASHADSTALPPVNVQASATVQAPMTASLAANLAFGTFTAERAGSVTLDPNTGTRTSSTNGPSLLNSGISRGQVNLSGAPETSFQVSLPATVDLVATGTGQKMTLTTATSLTGSTGQLNNTGTGAFYIGGNLAVALNQAPGTYTANIAVTVSYP